MSYPNDDNGNRELEEKSTRRTGMHQVNLQNDARFNQQLQGYYDRAIADINETINDEYYKFKDPEVAREAVSQMDVHQYQNTAKEIVAKTE